MVGNAAANLAGVMLAAVVEHTTIDDKLIEVVTAKVKEAIPGTTIEPILGEIFVRVGESLKAPNPMH